MGGIEKEKERHRYCPPTPSQKAEFLKHFASTSAETYSNLLNLVTLAKMTSLYEGGELQTNLPFYVGDACDYAISRVKALRGDFRIVTAVPNRLMMGGNEFLIRSLLISMLDESVARATRDSHFQLSAKKDEKNNLVFTLTDDGQCFQEEKLEFIFQDDLYTELHAHWRATGPIGLAVSRAILLALGGDMEIDNTDGAVAVVMTVPRRCDY